MAVSLDQEGASVEFLSEARGWELLEQRTQRYLRMSAREFIAR